LAKALVVVNTKTALRTIAAESAIFLIVNIVFSFVISPKWLRSTVTKIRGALDGRRFQPFPNTDPGLAGETGVSGDCGTVDGSDGLNVGAGTVGVSSKIGG
jgi:hypothetical protein